MKYTATIPSPSYPAFIVAEKQHHPYHIATSYVQHLRCQSLESPYSLVGIDLTPKIEGGYPKGG